MLLTHATLPESEAARHSESPNAQQLLRLPRICRLTRICGLQSTWFLGTVARLAAPPLPLKRAVGCLASKAGGEGRRFSCFQTLPTINGLSFAFILPSLPSGPIIRAEAPDPGPSALPWPCQASTAAHTGPASGSASARRPRGPLGCFFFSALRLSADTLFSVPVPAAFLPAYLCLQAP